MCNHQPVAVHSPISICAIEMANYGYCIHFHLPYETCSTWDTKKNIKNHFHSQQGVCHPEVY